jgi:DtxR family transcriptional regulator, Mn-dependent transcriptional regulator
MAEGFHPPVEEYLTTIYELLEDGVPVIQARLVERLGHAAPTVGEMTKRLVSEGHVVVTGRAITLTAKGRALAESVVRKHRLAERLLTDIIGLPWEKAHLEAGRWEHVISDEVEERLRVLLDDPSTCPHGNPIPGTISQGAHQFALSDANPGDEITLTRVTESVETDNDAMTYLAASQFITGTSAVVNTKAPDGTILLTVGLNTIALGAKLSSNLYVSRTPVAVPS